MSPRNEAAAVGALLGGLRRKLIGQRSSAADEEELIAGLEAEQPQRPPRQRDLEKEEGEGATRGLEGKWKAAEEVLRAESSGGRVGEGYDSAVAVQAREGRVAAESVCGKAGGGGAGVAVDVERKTRRQLAAARVRLEEKVVLAEAIAALEASLLDLQSAVGAGSAAELVSFRPLDA